MKHFWLLVAFLSSLAILPSTVRGDTVLFDSISSTTDGSDFISSTPPYSSGPLAASFSTGTSGFDFDSLSLILYDVSPTDGGSFTISLLGDSSGTPGATIETIATVLDSSLSASYAVYTFDTTTTEDLAALTRYWIELSGTDTSAVWAWTTSDSGPGVSTEYFYDPELGVVANSSLGPYQMEIPGVVLSTPEAGTLVLLIVALGALGVMSRKRLLG